MAKFRDSTINSPAEVSIEAQAEMADAVQDRSIGSIISELRNLSAEQVEQILSYQREHHVRFGEAAIALKLVTSSDVLQALSLQFHYPYAPTEGLTKSSELVTLTQPFSLQAEAFRAIRSQIMMRLNSERDLRKALAVISADAGDGKSFFTANLAVALAQLGGRTLLVDADLRGPRQHEIFDIPNQVGLSSVLAGRAEARVIQQIDGVPSLYVLPVGVTPPNPLELLERPAFGVLMRELLGKFDHVIVDTSAAVYGADASVVASRCGAALLMARKDESRLASLADLLATLDGCPTAIAGMIVNEY